MGAIQDKLVPSDGSPPTTGGTTLTTLSRGLAILEYVAKAGHLVRLRDVAERFAMDRSSALRFLRTLETEGYLVRHIAMKVYSLGPKLLTFPRLPDRVERVIELARPVLERLGRATTQVAHLATLNGLDAVLAEVVASDAAVSVKQAVGDLEPLYSSAVGKAIYAWLPEAERAAVGKQIDFVAFTPRTITSIAALDSEAATIRALGVAFDRQEGNEHVSCIGCPILDGDGTPVASIGVSYVTAHLSGAIEDLADHIALLKDAARTVGDALATDVR